MKKALFFGVALTLALTSMPAAFAEEVNMDAPYGDRQPGGYQHLTTHYQSYWRLHHHPWSNIERDREYVRQAQDFAKQTKVFEGCCRDTFVHASDNTVRERFNKYMWNSTPNGDFSSALPAYFIEQVKSRPSVSPALKEAIALNEFLPKPLSYNSITYMPDEFTKKQLHMPEQRYRSGLIGNDLILYDEVTGRVRGLWRDIIQ